jgi:cell division protein FtsZ
MTLNLNVPKTPSNLTPRITVVGVGGAGGNAVTNMIQSSLEGVEFLICNTDAQAMQQSICGQRIQMGRSLTQGLGAGARPDVGRAAAEEALDEIMSELEGSNMVFITAGMGGGTGTGGAPVIARAAREAGILAVGVVTKPFHFEGVHRMRMAEQGIQELTEYVDTLIVIPNQNLFRVANEKTTFADAFKMADDVLNAGVRGVTDLMVMPGLINLDFADIRSVMTEMGKAMMGTGEAEGENRAIAAAEAAISNPLLDDVSMKGARGVLINITGGPDMTLFEVDETANRIRDEVDPEANIIFGSTFDHSLEGRMRVSVVATGIETEAAQNPRPVSLSLVSSRAEQSASAPAPERASATAVTARATEAVSKPQASVETVASAAPAPSLTATARVLPEPEEETMAPQPAPAMPSAQSRPATANSLFTYSQQAVRGAPVDEGRSAAAARRAPEAPEARDEARRAPSESFIPPPAVEPEPAAEEAPVAPPQSASRVDPFAAAALANGSRAPRGEAERPAPAADGRRKTPGLLAKMAGGAAKALQSGDWEEWTRAARPGQPTQRVAPRSEPKAAPAPAAVKASSQPRLSGLDPADRLAGASQDEELLDIPAFLRRQAN